MGCYGDLVARTACATDAMRVVLDVVGRVVVDHVRHLRHVRVGVRVRCRVRC